MAATTVASAGNDDLLAQVRDKITDGSLALSDLLDLVQVPTEAPSLPAKVASAKEITKAQRDAMARVPKVYGSVVPTEPRALEPGEVRDLIDERGTLDEVKKMTETRIADITLTVHNHLDAVYEDFITEQRLERTRKVAAAGGDEQSVPPVQMADRDPKGHYVTAGTAEVEDRDKVFSREVRHGAPSLNVAALKALDTGEPDALLTHEEFLSMTTQTRVFDESKVMLALRKNPALIKAIAAATTPGGDSTAVYLRNKK